MPNSLNCNEEKKIMSDRNRFLIVFGTRPEAVKLAPVILKLKDIAEVIVCVTGQHREMLDQVLHFFSIRPDFDLNIMSKSQSLFDITSDALRRLEKVVAKSNPHLLIVQGDTTSSFVGALSGFYNQIKVAHVEAGLRSFKKYSPFPEEMNRVMVSHIADYHFAPTSTAQRNLLKEDIPQENIFVVGNTVIDALVTGLELVKQDEKRFYDYFRFLDFSKKILLVTGHRRESFGKPFENICHALKTIAENNVEIVYPVHLNPNVRGYVYPLLQGLKNIHLIEPLEYPHLIWLMSKCYLILTDSGGIQEEAPSLGKPVLVLRDVTERQEGIEAGTGILVGTNVEKIVDSTHTLLSNQAQYNKMAMVRNPYGDGKASVRIRDILQRLTG
ncbi:MAG: non-hydrolyzing UDP-N-acetylglucosamine 2-epimerase [Dissulfurispiraceae bacterium]